MSRDELELAREEIARLRKRLRHLALMVPLELLPLVTGDETPLFATDHAELETGLFRAAEIEVELERVWNEAERKRLGLVPLV